MILENAVTEENLDKLCLYHTTGGCFPLTTKKWTIPLEQTTHDDSITGVCRKMSQFSRLRGDGEACEGHRNPTQSRVRNEPTIQSWHAIERPRKQNYASQCIDFNLVGYYRFSAPHCSERAHPGSLAPVAFCPRLIDTNVSP